MSRSHRPWFWLLDLTATTVLAYVAAHAILNVAVAIWLPDPPLDETATAAITRAAPQARRADDTASLADRLSARSPMNQDPAAPPPPATVDVAPPTLLASAAPPEVPPLRKSTLPVQLVGTMVSPVDRDVRLATVLLRGTESDTVTVGSDVLGAKVLDVRHGLMVLREGDAITTVGLWSGTPGSSTPPGRVPARRPRLHRPPRPGASDARLPPRPRRSPSHGVRQVGDKAWAIDRLAMEERLQNPQASDRGVRGVPRTIGGKMDGMRLNGVRAGSTLHSLGLRSGDVVTSVNGHVIDSPNRVLALHQQLSTAGELQLTVLRRGRSETLNYEIR